MIRLLTMDKTTLNFDTINTICNEILTRQQKREQMKSEHNDPESEFYLFKGSDEK